VRVIGVNRKSEELAITLLVMRIYSGFLGASRACASLRDSITEPRLNTSLRRVKANNADGLVRIIFIC